MEFIFEIVFEGILELATNKKVSKWLRYPLVALILVVYIAIIISFSFLAFIIIQDTLLGGIALFLLVIVFIGMGISFYRKKVLDI